MEYWGENTRLTTTEKRTTVNAMSAGAAWARRCRHQTTTSHTRPTTARTVTTAAAIPAPATATSIAPYRYSNSTPPWVALMIRNGNAATDSTCRPRLPCPPRNPVRSPKTRAVPASSSTVIATKLPSAGSERRRGTTASTRTGHTLKPAPIAAQTPVRTGWAAAMTASTAKRVGTTSNRATRIGPITTPKPTQYHPAANLWRVRTMVKIRSTAMIANNSAVAGSDPIPPARKKNADSGGYCHMSSTGSRPSDRTGSQRA